MKNYTLGINAYHADSSTALLINGEVVCATEEEVYKAKTLGRFTNKIH